jgi:signal transduction histidine kinase
VQYSEDVKEIKVRVRRNGPMLAVDVADRGVGIERSRLGRVFERFYTSRRRMDSRTQSGLGLGLALAYEIMRAHGGDISVQSEVGKGSTFTVVLPVPPVEAETPQEAEEPSRLDRAAGRDG